MLLTIPSPSAAPTPLPPISSTQSDRSIFRPHELPHKPSDSSLSASAVLPPLSPAMTTPHRPLPPPSSISLPDPSRSNPQVPTQQPHTGLPAPPAQWQVGEDSMRNWLMTKAEEEKRRQEEEKTRQEQLRLEQRKIEHGMLQESFRNGIPPYLVPMIFAGIGGMNVVGLELFQQHAAQSTAAHGVSTEGRTGGVLATTTTAGPSASSAALLPSQNVQTQLQPGVVQYMKPYTTPGGSARTASGPVAGPTSAPRPQQLQSVLPRISPHDPQQTPAALQGAQGGAHAQAGGVHAPAQPQAEQSSPSIYFHHWVPPSTHAGGSNPTPATPTGDYASSPKKRKSQGAHQPVPPPSGPARQPSPPLSTPTSGRRGHGRQRSDTSGRGLPEQAGGGSFPSSVEFVPPGGIPEHPRRTPSIGGEERRGMGGLPPASAPQRSGGSGYYGPSPKGRPSSPISPEESGTYQSRTGQSTKQEQEQEHGSR